MQAPAVQCVYRSPALFGRGGVSNFSDLLPEERRIVTFPADGSFSLDPREIAVSWI
jgi:hypothetical protein